MTRMKGTLRKRRRNHLEYKKHPFSSRSASALFCMNDLLHFAHFSKLIHSVIPFCKTTSESLPFP